MCIYVYALCMAHLPLITNCKSSINERRTHKCICNYTIIIIIIYYDNNIKNLWLLLLQEFSLAPVCIQSALLSLIIWSGALRIICITVSYLFLIRFSLEIQRWCHIIIIIINVMSCCCWLRMANSKNWQRSQWGAIATYIDNYITINRQFSGK